MSNKENPAPGYLDMELLRFTTAGSVDDGKEYADWYDCCMIPKPFLRTRWNSWSWPVNAGEKSR